MEKNTHNTLKTKERRRYSIATIDDFKSLQKHQTSVSKSRLRNQLYNVHTFVLNKSDSVKSTHDESYGFTMSGYCPCYVENVEYNSISYLAGIKPYDLIMKINDVNCCRATLKSCLSLIKNSSVTLNLTVYRFKEPKVSRIKSFKSSNTKKISKRGAVSKLFLSKIFRPSLWLPCGSSLSGCVFNGNEITLNQTYYNSGTPAQKTIQSDLSPKKNSASQLTTNKSADTGYETASNTDTGSNADSKNNKLGSINEEMSNISRTELIENLLEMESDFITFLSMGVAQLARPLRGFLMKQQDYFTLFQNIEKILIISENFLRSMDKWSSLDLYTRIGQLYTQKLNLFREAFTIYIKGHGTSKCLLNDLKSHSQEFRLFVNETQSGNLTLSNLIDLPLIHIHGTLNCFKQIKKFTTIVDNNSVDSAHIDAVISDLRRILSHSSCAENLSLEEVDLTLTDKVQSVEQESVLMSTQINSRESFENV